MSTKVHSYLGGLNQDVTNKFEMTSNATVTVGNGTTTGNIHAGGNIAIGNISPRANGLAVATNVKLWHSTSSPTETPAKRNAKCMAAVPETTQATNLSSNK